MTAPPPNARDRILKASAYLFYLEGIRSISVDAIAERAEVTKKTLYYHFTSKDDLVAAYLSQRDQQNLAAFAGWLGAEDKSLPERIETVFTRLAETASHPKWRGCGFLRTIAELANQPGHPARKIGATHKKKVETWLEGILHANGIAAAPSLAQQIAVLIDGAFAAMLTHSDPGYARTAGIAARTLVTAALVEKA